MQHVTFTAMFCIYTLRADDLIATHTHNKQIKRQWVSVVSAEPYAICTLTQTHNHVSIPPLSFVQAGCPSCHPTNSVKALKAVIVTNTAILAISQYWYLNHKTITRPTMLLLLLFYGSLDFLQHYLGKPVPKGKTRKVKPIWIYWSKR